MELLTDGCAAELNPLATPLTLARSVTRWALRLQCSNCHTSNPQPVYLDPATKQDIPGSRGQVRQAAGPLQRELKRDRPIW